MIIPIRTQSEVRQTPRANYALLALNVLAFVVFDERFIGSAASALRERLGLAFVSASPELYQFFTYQFLHGDMWHLAGNMLFLWVFGNSVNGKMGDLPYLLFYLAGGVFAAWGFAVSHKGPELLVGASGSIAAITTAYLVLFPRSRVTVLFLFFFITFFEVSAMLIIGLKIIVWDNIIAPGIGGVGNVAYQAHWAGYIFGFFGTMGMLLIRALPRDQFDMLALWSRWKRRREFAGVSRESAARPYGPVSRPEPISEKQRTVEDEQLDKVSDLRSRIAEALVANNMSAAADLYEEMLGVDPKQCLSEAHQLAVARYFYTTDRFAEAVAAFERFIECYPRSNECSNVRLLLGIVYARDLEQWEKADHHLTKTWQALRDEGRRAQCWEWLSNARRALGRPIPQPPQGC